MPGSAGAVSVLASPLRRWPGFGNGQLEFHFAGDVELVAADSFEQAAGRASTGQGSYVRQDPGGAVLICGNVHGGVGPNVSLFFPAGWSVSRPRTDSDFLPIDEGGAVYETDQLFGKIINCPPREGVTQVYIALAEALADVRVVALGKVITVTAVSQRAPPRRWFGGRPALADGS